MRRRLLSPALASLLGLGACVAELMPPAAPLNYTETTRASLPLEQRFTAKGRYAVASLTFPSGQSRFSTYKVWYPEGIASGSEVFPVVVFANGSGVVYKRYEAVFEHLASWGFVVVGNDDGTSWDGSSSSRSLAFLEELAHDSTSPLFEKIDIDRAGVSGHSQGGVGAINAVGNFPNSTRFKSIYTASTTQHDLARALGWRYDPASVRIPYLMVSGTGSFDGGNGMDPKNGIAPLSSLMANADGVSGDSLTILARRRDLDHGEMLHRPNGYMVAWFRYTLRGDPEAAGAFAGPNPEIVRNTQNWQDVRITGIPL